MIDTSSRTWVEAWGAEYGDFLMEVQNMSPEEWEGMKAEVGMSPDDEEVYEVPEDAHLEAAYEDRYSMYDNDLLDMEDFGSMYDNDPNPYEGTYSEE